jgi:hypothetical protein
MRLTAHYFALPMDLIEKLPTCEETRQEWAGAPWELSSVDLDIHWEASSRSRATRYTLKCFARRLRPAHPNTASHRASVVVGVRMEKRCWFACMAPKSSKKQSRSASLRRRAWANSSTSPRMALSRFISTTATSLQIPLPFARRIELRRVLAAADNTGTLIASPTAPCPRSPFGAPLATAVVTGFARRVGGA